ncbi:MAG TPA: aminotransferase class V-fold PLP-dependent enzyme [Anaerolineae bacterium]
MWKDLFLLDPEVVFLNHGSFGATPRPVFEIYQEWQRRLERQPVHFIATELPQHFETARQRLGNYLNADKDDVVYVPNATFALNIVARSLPLQEGDEVLATNHEYGACDRVWRFVGQKKGFRYLQQPIALPVTSADETIDQLWQGVTPRTKVIFVSHITSSTALCLPVAKICKRAREAGILTVVDGAHAPGQVLLDLGAIGVDFYCGNAHKWLCGPKGSGFLYTRPERQHLIEPLVVSWGWGEGRTLSFGSDYLDYLQWVGTNDPAAYLAVPAAIAFQEAHNWPAVRRECHQLVEQAIHRICELTGLAPLYPDNARFYHQMATVPLPQIADLTALKKRLYEAYRVEIPLLEWQGRHFIRISVQAYNMQSDIDTLLEALTVLLPHFVK